MRRAGLLILLTLAHVGLSIGTTALLFAVAMKHFDAGEPPTAMERLLTGVNETLVFPVIMLPLGHLPRVLHNLGMFGEYLPFLLNSFLWAVAILVAVELWRRRRSRTPPHDPLRQPNAGGGRPDAA